MADAPVFKLPPYTVSSRLLSADLPPLDKSLQLVGVPNAWKFTKGSGVKIAVLDTGIDTTHPDFVGAIIAAKDFTRSRFGVEDRHGHGTHVAGTIGARGRVSGIAPECDLYVGKVLGDDGSGDGAAIAAGIDWAVAQGVDVISMSLGSPQPDVRIAAAIRRAVAAGIIVIVAAGNDGRSNAVNWPAKMPDVIAVSAMDDDGKLATFSSYGPEIDFAAPGVNITSCAPGGGYQVMSGTSMATPHLAGLVVLGLAAVKDFVKPRTPQQTISRIREHVTDLGVPGRDDKFGWGVVDLRKLPEPPPEVSPVPTPGPIVTVPTQPIVLNGVALEPVTLGDGRSGVFIPKVG